MRYVGLVLALQIAALILVAGCRQDAGPAPAPEQPPQHVEEKQTETDVPPTVEPPQTSQVTDLAGVLHEGVMGDPPGDVVFSGVIFRPSQITEADASAYSIRTHAGELKSMTFVTERPAFEVKEFYMSKLSQAVDAGNSIEGKHNGRRVVVLLSGGTAVTFEVQVWLP